MMSERWGYRLQVEGGKVEGVNKWIRVGGEQVVGEQVVGEQVEGDR